MYNWKRTSTKKLSEKDQQTLWNFISAERSKEELEEILWMLTCAPIETLKELGVEELTNDVAHKVRAEIRNYFQEKMQWDFMACIKSEGDKASYGKLSKALNGDQHALYEVIMACKAQGYMEESSIAYVINCLKSSWEETGRKGLYRLGFENECEIDYLAPHRKLIAEFISELYQIDADKYRPQQGSVSEVVSYLTEQEDVGETAEEAVEETVTVSAEGCENNAITADEVVKHQKDIRVFLKLCEEIPQYEWLATHQEVVNQYMQILDAHPKFMGVLTNLDKVKALLAALDNF